MIVKFRHKGLKRLFEDDDRRGVNPKLAEVVESVLDMLNVAQAPEDLDIHGFRLHPLKGDRKGQWSMTLSGNWRIVFEFEGTDVTNVDLVDYH